MEKKISGSKILSNEQFEWAIVLFCQCIFIGLVCSRALASIGMIALIILSLLYNGRETFKIYFQSKELWVLSLFFWIVLFSGINSADKHEWLNWVRIKLPYLFLPLAFAPIKKLNDKKFITLLYGFILTLWVSAAIILGRYFSNYETITDSFLKGSAIPIHYSHIRYTLMLAFSFFCAVYLLEKRYYLFHKSEKWLQVLYTLFAFAALHILTVRSGLLALYLGLVCLAFKWFWQKRFLLGTLIILLVGVLPFGAYRFVPSFHNKVSYMQYDLGQYQKGAINENSDAMRIVSMKIGYELWKSNPWFGVGAGDLEAETNNIYECEYPDISPNNRRVPHNQFIWVLASTGIIGFVLFLTAFFVPLFSKGYYNQWPVVVLYVLLFASFFGEDTFEEQIGTGFYLIFLLILMNYFKRE